MSPIVMSSFIRRGGGVLNNDFFFSRDYVKVHSGGNNFAEKNCINLVLAGCYNYNSIFRNSPKKWRSCLDLVAASCSRRGETQALWNRWRIWWQTCVDFRRPRGTWRSTPPGWVGSKLTPSAMSWRSRVSTTADPNLYPSITPRSRASMKGYVCNRSYKKTRSGRLSDQTVSSRWWWCRPCAIPNAWSSVGMTSETTPFWWKGGRTCGRTSASSSFSPSWTLCWATTRRACSEACSCTPIRSFL